MVHTANIPARLVDTHVLLTIWPSGAVRLLLFLEKMDSTGPAIQCVQMPIWRAYVSGHREPVPRAIRPYTNSSNPIKIQNVFIQYKETLS